VAAASLLIVFRIGLYHGPLYRGPDGYETYGPYARYVAEFARHFDEVVVFAPVTTRATAYRGCPLPGPNIRVVALPDFETHVQAARHLPRLACIFAREAATVDVINCRNTAPFGYLLYFFGRRHGVGFFYHFTSDPWEVLHVAAKYRGAYGHFARAAYLLDTRIQAYVMRRTYSFVNGRLPHERLRPITDRLEPVISSTLTAADLVPRTERPLHTPVRLLYVGYLKHMKGLHDLVEALARLVAGGSDVELHLVGTGPEEAALRADVARRGLTPRVHFHGYVPLGSALYRFYDEADIFVFPSLSEGSPRVVLEALAHSLPVVSTRVGSVPDLIRHRESGLIVPTHDPEGLASAVLEYLNDEWLRVRCLRAGFAAAAGHTVEAFLAPLVRKARELAQARGRGTR
jgi:glycosyltransferase involved in cell wall biosynthesis